MKLHQTVVALENEEDVSLREKVFRALDNAKGNGFIDMLSGSASEIAHDLVMYDSGCEDHTTDELIPYIKEWQAKNQK